MVATSGRTTIAESTVDGQAALEIVQKISWNPGGTLLMVVTGAFTSSKMIGLVVDHVPIPELGIFPWIMLPFSEQTKSESNKLACEFGVPTCITTVSRKVPQLGELTTHTIRLVPIPKPLTEVCNAVGLAITAVPCATIQDPEPLTIGSASTSVSN